MFYPRAEVIYRNRQHLYTCLPVSGVGVELGVHRGKNAKDLLEIAKPSLLHLVDPWTPGEQVCNFDSVVPSEQAYQEILDQFGTDPRVQVHRAFSWDVLELWPDGYLDWCYLDSSHFYRETVRELALLDRKLKPTGVLAGHDYCPDTQGVINAVDELCKEKGWKLMFATREDYYPSFGLVRRD